jgi:hypothetical protein
MSSHPQSKAELNQHLQDELHSLEILADEYDKGFSGASKHLAAILRVLLHTRGQSIGLLNQLGLEGIEFYDTTFPIEPNQITSYSGLIQWGSDGKYTPLLDSNPQCLQKINFSTWWENTVLMWTTTDKESGAIQKKEFSRRDLILYVADKDGGAHIDATLPNDYAEVSRLNSLCRMYGDGQSWSPYEHPELASVRQIAHEVLRTLKSGYTKTLLPPAGPMPPILNINVVTTPIVESEIPESWKKTGRNQPCPCGSGKKWKYCHGKPKGSK